LLLAACADRTVRLPQNRAPTTTADLVVVNDFCKFPDCGEFKVEECIGVLTAEEARASLDGLAASWSNAGTRPYALRESPAPPTMHTERRESEDGFAPFPDAYTNDVLAMVAPNFTALTVMAGKRTETYFVCSKRTIGSTTHIQWGAERLVH